MSLAGLVAPPGSEAAPRIGVGGSRLLGRSEATKVYALSVVGDSGPPADSALGDPIHARGVPLVLGLSGFAEIADPVVEWITIDVVKNSGGPLTMGVEPGKAMGEVAPAIDADLPSTLESAAPRYPAHEARLSMLQPPEDARVRVVMEDVVKPTGREGHRYQISGEA